MLQGRIGIKTFANSRLVTRLRRILSIVLCIRRESYPRYPDAFEFIIKICFTRLTVCYLGFRCSQS